MTQNLDRSNITNITLNRKAISITEIMVGIALFVLAAIPSFGYLMSSVKQTAATDMENTAGVIAGSILDRILDNVEYDMVDDTLKLDQISGMPDEDGSDNNELKIKSTSFKLELEVKTIPNDQIEFGFRKTPYIKRQSSDSENADPGNDINSIKSDAKRWNTPVKLKLSQITKHKNKTFLKEIMLVIKWKDPVSGRDRTEKFTTMKANLSLVEQQGG
ncbi:MAG TPA: hypothetical protein PK467_18175 [Candidatus Wallbacteria bacterium]|nr:hypothetical protein [Candidatus Wallbacteria bacterium]